MQTDVDSTPSNLSASTVSQASGQASGFMIRNDDLGRLIKMLNGVVDHSQVIQILSFLKCSIRQSLLHLTASNSEIEMHVHIPLVDVSPSLELDFTLPCKKLFDISKSLPGDAMLEFILETNWTKLKAGKTTFKLASLPVDQFPHMEKQAPQTRIKIQESTLVQALKQTQFCMGSNDVRFFLNGLLFQCDGNELTLVATDGHRLACTHCKDCDIQFEAEQAQYILPRKTVQELVKYLQESEDNIEICFSSQYFSFQSDRVTIYSNLIDGDYPAYQKLIPKQHTAQATLSVEALKQSLNRLLPLANEKYHGAKFNFSEQGLHISTQNIHHEEAEDELTIAYPHTEALTIGFNIHYVLDVLNVMNVDNLSIALIDKKHSVAFEGIDSDQDTVFIIMPLDL